MRSSQIYPDRPPKEASEKCLLRRLISILERHIHIRPTVVRAIQGKPTDPGCLCGVLPSVDSYRMNGLWAKAAGKNIETLEDADPKKSARRSMNTPIGLENLGNTCYINSVLQCLFAIEDFKHAILSAADIPQLEENHVFQSLKCVSWFL